VGGARVWQITSEARRGPLGGDRRVPERHLIGRVSFDAAFCKKPRRVFLIQESLSRHMRRRVFSWVVAIRAVSMMRLLLDSHRA